MPVLAAQGLIGITLSAGLPALHDGHNGVNGQGFFIGMLYVIALGAYAHLPLGSTILCCVFLGALRVASPSGG
jgi:hypothetical protein